MTARKFVEIMDTPGGPESLGLKPTSLGNCPRCGDPVMDRPRSEVELIDNLPAHKDCYFEGLGELVEANPWSFRSRSS